MQILINRFIPLVIICCLMIGCGDDTQTKVSTTNNSEDCSAAALPFSADIFNQPGMHLYVIGDTGTGDQNQQHSASILELYHSQFPLDVIVHTGDIFYYNGISTADDNDTFTKFLNIYQPLAIANVPWYLVAGNHEHDGSIKALIEFADKFDWINFPNNYYNKTWQVNESSTAFSVNLIATDTTPFTSGLPQVEQLAWLNQQLATSTESINIVVGHHPIYSNGSQGNTEVLTKDYLQQLKHFNVPLYLSGHEHNLEYINQNSPLHMVISGAGGAPLGDISCGENSRFASKQWGGFALYITEQTFWIIVVTSAGFDLMYKVE